MRAEVQNKQENREFRILSAIAIVLVVAGHADFHVLDMGGLFPYYSFHVAVFLFISGYFYEETAKQQIGTYIRKKAQRLLLPYFVWNLFYGLFTAALHGAGFKVGGKPGLRELLVEPFLGGHQFGWNFPSWFVPALFLTEVLNVCMRKVAGWLHAEIEWLIFSLCLLAGMAAVQLSIGGHVWGYYKVPGRILFMLPCYQMGCIYKKKLERHDTLPDGIYFGVLLVLQLVIVFSCGGLAYSMVWCTSFANGPAVPYLTTVTGIAFWLRIAKILAPYVKEQGGLYYTGRNTYAVMMHHILGFLLVKGVFYAAGTILPWCPDFDKAALLTDTGYIYLPGGQEAFKWVYMAAGIGVPLLIQRCVSGTAQYIWRRRRDGRF